MPWDFGAFVQPMEEEPTEPSPQRRWTKRHIFGAAFLLLFILIAIAWWQRFHIADSYIRDQLRKNGIRATYEIEEIGLRTERLRNLVVGDPANPDMTAKSVAIDVTIGFGMPEIRMIRASGVRLKGRFAQDKLYLGELDKLRDMDSKDPMTLPDINLALRDTVLSLRTPWGGIGIAAQGQGNLRNRFDGRLVAHSRRMANGGCLAKGLRYDGRLRIRNVRPEFTGPLRAEAVNCDNRQLASVAPSIDGTIRFTESFDRWVGDVEFRAQSVRSGNRNANDIAGDFDFDGNARRMAYNMMLVKAALQTPEIATRQVSGNARGTLSFGSEGAVLASRGSASLAGASLPPTMLPSMGALVGGTKTTPIGPVVARLAPALQSAARGFDSTFDFDIALSPNANTIDLDRMFVRSDSGLILRQESRFAIRGGALSGPLVLTMNGGDLPVGRLSMQPSRDGWKGTLALQPYSATGGSASIPSLAFEGGGGRPWTFRGQAVLSGPLMGGSITGLSLPIDGVISGNGFAMNSGCTDVRYTSIATGAVRLPAGRMRACPQGGSILSIAGGKTRFAFTMPTLALAGTLGTSPFRANGSGVAFDLDRGFGASNVAIDLGRGDGVSRFSIVRFDGKFEGSGIRGTLTGGTGQIGTVPLLIGEAQGQWRWQNDILSLNATLFVTDATEVDRFNRLRVPDFHLNLANNRISAIGTLTEPESGAQVADVQILHDLANARGNALLSVDGLRFDDRLQPEKITPLTLGHIANVQGRVSGTGRIEWNGESVRSTGRFSVAPTDLAAAFGPVDGLSTEIVFTDLLGMVTAPNQLARLKTVNPGIPAFDGTIRYQLLPDQKVQIQEGRWPFYGGELILEPTILDFDVEAKRELTFRLIGLDAEKFLGNYDFENLRVSGTFDGTLPMVFDQQGGRIVGGWLVSRDGGGELSYLGELSYKDMGAMANFAFQALRSIRFEEMQIGIDGNLGGEVVTEVRLRGVKQGSLAQRNFITRQLAKLPLEFNIRIQAEFLSLIGNIRTIYDGEYAAERFKSQIELPEPVPGE
ncbi:MAG: intermembrane phospholipid transport protein YdbH family protein [Sphingorhabdus sp.]